MSSRILASFIRKCGGMIEFSRGGYGLFFKFPDFFQRLRQVRYLSLVSSGVSVVASIARIVFRTDLAFSFISSSGKSGSSFSK